MGKILDLNVFQEKTLDIRMLDGKILHIRKPTQAMVIRMLRMRQINAESDPETIVQSIDRMVLDILNSNDEGRAFDASAVNELSVQTKGAVITAYSEFITGLQSDPN